MVSLAVHQWNSQLLEVRHLTSLLTIGEHGKGILIAQDCHIQ